MAEDRHFSIGVPIPCRRPYGRFVVVGHPLLESNVKSAIESAASRHLGRRWVSYAFTDLNDRASHPCGVLHGEPFSVFAKLDIGDNAEEMFQAELSGLTLLRDRARIAIPTPIGTGILQLDHGFLLLTEATRGTYRKLLRVTWSASFIDCHRSAVQSHNQRCFTATLNNTTSSAPMTAPW